MARLGAQVMPLVLLASIPGVISHRFSTVRMADAIVVLHAGSVAESGSHEQLLSQRGVYAKLFELQARGYREALQPLSRDSALYAENRS